VSFEAETRGRPDPLGRVLFHLSAALAMLGGVLLSAVALMTVVSIIGRNLASVPGLAWLGPVPGDFELVELGVGMAIFAFLPYCQMVRGNVAVDFFVAKASAHTKAWLAFIGNALYTAIAIVIAWQLYEGYVERLGPYGETSWILGIPLKWPYLVAFITACLLSAVTAYTTWRSLGEALGEGEPRR
jgi:TRAP-type C4-dicarboxylate transport system permease small subunit